MVTEEDWKASKFRIFVIAVGLFLITSLTMYLNNIPNMMQVSLILSLGYVISSFTLSVAKKIWVKYLYK